MLMLSNKNKILVKTFQNHNVNEIGCFIQGKYTYLYVRGLIYIILQ